jgi:hypothetical protein
MFCFPATKRAGTLVTWQIFNADNTLRETMTFTPIGATLFPGNAAEVHFADMA